MSNGFGGSSAKSTYMGLRTFLWLWMGVNICLKNPKQRKMSNSATFLADKVGSWGREAHRQANQTWTEIRRFESAQVLV